MISQAWSVISPYGWYILIVGILLTYVWYHVIGPRLTGWRNKQSQVIHEEDHLVKAERHDEAMRKSREAMQKRLDNVTMAYSERQQEKETRERDDKIKQWESFKVITKSRTKHKDNVNGGHYPLSGGGGRQGGYRPPPRSRLGQGG
jgi:hypothetical protein